MALIRGENVLFQIFDGGQWKLYACARSCSLNVVTDTIETSVSGTGVWATFLPTKNSWTATADGIVNLQQPNMLSLADLRAKQYGQQLIVVTYQRTDEDGNVYSERGSAIITSSEDTGSFTDVNTFTITLQGTGPLTPLFIPSTSTASKVKVFNYTGIGGETIFDNSVLANESIVGAYKDGVQHEVITSGSPGDKQVLYTADISSNGRFTWPIAFESGERATIQYQDF